MSSSSEEIQQEITYRVNELESCMKNPVRPRRCIYLATALRVLTQDQCDKSIHSVECQRAESLLDIFISKPDLRLFAAKAIFDAEEIDESEVLE